MATLIGRLFHVRYTLRGTSYLLHRIGSSRQTPDHSASVAGLRDISVLRWSAARKSQSAHEASLGNE